MDVKIHKAQAVGDIAVPDATIVISEPIEDFDTLMRQDTYCGIEAAQLEMALHATLPGATYNRLLVEMLGRTAGHLRVSHRRRKA